MGKTILQDESMVRSWGFKDVFTWTDGPCVFPPSFSLSSRLSPAFSNQDTVIEAPARSILIATFLNLFRPTFAPPLLRIELSHLTPLFHIEMRTIHLMPTAA